MNIKAIITFCIVITMQITTWANECNLVVAQQPGGATDLYLRAMQRINPDIRIEYKPGAFANLAINHINTNTSSALWSAPIMFSKDNSIEVDIEYLKFIVATDIIIVSNKNLSTADFLNKPIMLGIPFLGSPPHIVAEQLKLVNPNITMIPTGGDVKALPLLMNKEVDAYISATPNMIKWLRDFKTLNEVMLIDTDKKTVIRGVEIHNPSIVGIAMSKKSSLQEKQHIAECFNKVINTDEWKVSAKAMNIKAIDISGKDLDKALNNYIMLMKKF